ncbi:hypothetical protein AB0346_07955 [Nocardia beijingensis]|uniref:hypothetical protein n=1 Tax=Nocardia beijingensis TaxID=95162 RepID=UPI00344BC813
MPVVSPLIKAANMSQLIAMNPDYPQYELLAKALDAQFGNIYEYNLGEGQDAGIDVQEWTDELRAAVRRYVLHDLPADVGDWLFHSKDRAATDVDVEKQVDQLLHLEPWEVAFEVRNAAVAAVPTLRELIGHLDTWPSGEESADAVVWLEAHSTLTEWRAVAEASTHDELHELLAANQGRALTPHDLVRVLSPPELLAAWQWQFGPAESDLTDDEWRLIESAIPPRKIGTRRGEIVFRPWKEHQLAQRRPQSQWNPVQIRGGRGMDRGAATLRRPARPDMAELRQERVSCAYP